MDKKIATTQKTGYFIVATTVIREYLELSRGSDFKDHLTSKIDREMAEKIMNITSDGREYVIKRLGWIERDGMDSIQPSTNYELHYIVTLLAGTNAQIGEYVTLNAVHPAGRDAMTVEYFGRHFKLEHYRFQDQRIHVWRRVT
jgi:hypothetical protein